MEENGQCMSKHKVTYYDKELRISHLYALSTVVGHQVNTEETNDETVSEWHTKKKTGNRDTRLSGVGGKAPVEFLNVGKRE